jgi:hypothetical protein
MVKRLALVTVIVVVVGWLLTPPRPPNFSNPVPLPLNETTTTTTTTVQTSNIIRMLDTVVLPHNMLCPQWAQIAVDVGWREEDLPMLDYVIHRESRCFIDAYSNRDPNGGSYGLAQVNGYWCRPSRWYPQGYLQAFGVLEQCSDLLHPRTNLLSARLIWLYSDREHNNGWLPWRT